MVVRDTQIDFINVNCWGTKEYIDDLMRNIELNSCGNLELIICLVTNKKNAFFEN